MPLFGVIISLRFLVESFTSEESSRKRGNHSYLETLALKLHAKGRGRKYLGSFLGIVLSNLLIGTHQEPRHRGRKQTEHHGT